MRIIDLPQDIFRDMMGYPGHSKTAMRQHATHLDSFPRLAPGAGRCPLTKCRLTYSTARPQALTSRTPGRAPASCRAPASPPNMCGRPTRGQRDNPARGADDARPMTGDGASPPERPYGAGTSAVDWESRYDFGGLRAKRIARARAAMETDHLDAVLVWKSENVRYLTSLRSQILASKDSILNAALLIGDQPPVLLCSGGEAGHAAFMPWLGAVHAVPIMEQAELIEGFVANILAPVLAGRGRRAAPSGWTRSASP